MKRNKKAFTIIELIVVIAIIGILVLLATPRILGYTRQAKLTRIKHDVKVMEGIMEDELVRNNNKNYDKFLDNGKDLGLLITNNSLYEKQGHASKLEYIPIAGEVNGLSNKLDHFSLKNNLGIGGPEIPNNKDFVEMYQRYKIVPEEYKEKAGSKLKGTFHANINGKVYYEHNKPLGGNSTGGNEDTGKPEEPKEPEVPDTPATDFEFVASISAPNSYIINGETKRGYFKYIGSDTTVKIPKVINGNEIKDYYNMFENSNVSKVISNNPNITNMGNMFDNSKATSLDLSSFNTSRVTSMGNMFRNSQATSLNLSSFDTSKVTNMGYMFDGSQATLLDLSSFDTSKVTTMTGMFGDSQATVGYARTQAEADKYNATSKPAHLTFIVCGPASEECR